MAKKLITPGFNLSFLLASLVFFCSHQTAWAEIRLMDGKLILSGFLKNTTYVRTDMTERDKEFHDSMIDFSKNSFFIDALYTAKETDDLTVRLYAGLKYWYEAAPSFDETLGRSIAHKLKKRYVMPRHFDDDMLVEAYVNLIKGPWDVRIGKQIVVWGQLDVERATDVINPLDLRYGPPGIEAWEEMKKGLWMIRTTYTTELPGNIYFEGIFNPGHYQGQDIGIIGTHWSNNRYLGQGGIGENGVGVPDWQFHRMRYEDDKQRWKSNYWSLAFRVGGSFQLLDYSSQILGPIDWTLLWHSTPHFGSFPNPPTASAYTINYMKKALPAMFRGAKVIGWGMLDPPTAYPEEVYRHPRYQTFGGTLVTVTPFFRDLVWRLEWFYKKAEPFNKSTDGKNGSNTYALVRRDVVGFGLQASDRWMLPWIGRNIGTGKKMDVTFTYFRTNIRNPDNHLVKTEYRTRRNDAHRDQISWFMQQALFNFDYMVTIIGYFYPRRGAWMNTSTVTYVFPGEHWRVDLGYILYGARRGLLEGAYGDKDSVIFRLRYEF